MEDKREYPENYHHRVAALRRATGALEVALGEDGTASWHERPPPPRVIVTPRNRRSAVLEARVDDDYLAVRIGEYSEVALVAIDFSASIAALHSMVVEMLDAEIIEEVQADVFGRALSSRAFFREERRLRRIGASGFRVPLWRVRRQVFPPYRS